MTWVYGVDASYDLLTEDEAQRLKAAGVAVYAQCLWTGAEQPPSRVISLRNAQAVGLVLVGYISITASQPGAWHVERGRTGVPDDLWSALVKVPVDVELPGLTLGMVQVAHTRLRDYGKPADVYTNYNTWVNVLGNPQRPEGCGLWNASWDADPDLDYPRLRFGGWWDDEVWGEQWSGGTYVEGQFVDRNQFRAEALGIGVPSTTPTPTPPFVPTPAEIQLLAAFRALKKE